MNELELILTDIFKCSRTNLYLNSPKLAFNDRKFETLDRIFRDRAKTKPVQYILGHTEFMGLRINVNNHVLIPRPETEILAESIIEKKANASGKKSKIKILEIGTGSGCIAIALAKFLDNVEVVATDISQKALDLAKENSILNKVDSSIKFIRADIFDHKILKSGIKFDVIVSNPPYVPTGEIGSLEVSVLNEPRISLDGGKDGLDFYREISKHYGELFKNNGLLFLEIGYGQAEGIRDIFRNSWVIEEFKKDYQGIDRICIIKRSENG
jgi:release factor glutamine methyltransferase